MKPLAAALILSFAGPAFVEGAGPNAHLTGFIERFALAADREKALGELVPGSEEYYFFHALHWQNTRDAAKLNEILSQWRKRMPDENPQRRMIENREAIINYERDPQATLKYLTEHLGVRHDHQQEVRDQKPDLPTQLDPARIARGIFLRDALGNDRSLQSLSQDALASLIAERIALTAEQRRAVLHQLQRPDVPNLAAAIITDLRADTGRSFGDLPIHRALLPGQLDELLKAFPDWLGHQAFVHTRLRKLAPSADVDIEFDEAEREAWLDRVWSFAQSLPPSQNTLKSRILYLRLDHDRKKGIYDRARFLEYLKLPRKAGYINPRLVERSQSGFVSDLNADLSEPLLSSPPIGSDEELVRECFLHLFAREAKPESSAEQLLAPWTEYVRDTWLKPVLAEALITHGIGNPERWASLITPAAFQQLKERVDVEFPKTNAPRFLPGDDIQFEVVIKNTPKLIVKIFELNTLNFFKTQIRQLNTDLNLDGLVANSEQTHSFDIGPFKRLRQTFKFPDLKGRRGAWIIEFIGAGRSSRALVRAGQWQVLQQAGPAGDLLLVLDEKNQPVADAVAWFEGRKLARDEKLGRIVVPFTNQPGTKPLIVGDPAGTFATLTQFHHHAEEYRLDAQFHIEREQLLARREATLAVRTALMIGESHLAPELLIEPKLTITSSTHDGISTTRTVGDLKLSAGRVLTHQLTVPERLSSLSVTLTAKVEVLSAGGERRDVTAQHTWTINGIDRTEAVNDGHLSNFDGNRVFELLGKNGEPIPDQQVIFTFKHHEFDRVQTIPLRTDDKGRVHLGKLQEIELITARIPNGRISTWPIDNSQHTLPAAIQIQAGETIRIPWSAGFNAPEHPAKASLLMQSFGAFIADKSDLLKQEAALLTIAGLTPGDYSLRFPHDDRFITIRVTAGDAVGGWVLGKHRHIELKGNAPLHIAGIESDAEIITIKLANSSSFARVHIAASRFDPGDGIFGGLGGFARFGPALATAARLPNLYSSGREIGDEYRYILERRYAKVFPGNMLTRPGLLLNPWEVRSTDLEHLGQQSGESAGQTRGGRAGAATDAPAEPARKRAQGGAVGEGGANLDFLATSAPAIFNLSPDKDGLVRIDRKALGDRQHVQIFAADLQNASWRAFALPELDTKFADQRFARNLDPAQPFAQKKEVAVLEAGKAFTLADILTSELETYDTVGGVHSLFATLSKNSNLALFEFITAWPKLSAAAQHARYNEHACHELSFFLCRKDKPFFDRVIKPLIANKKDKTFMDHYLLESDLHGYLEPWAYARLNIVERILLAQRIDNEAPNAARHVRELWEMIPPDPEQADWLFETALTGRALEYREAGAGAAFDAEKERLGKAMAVNSLMMAPAPAAAVAAPADPFGALTPADPLLNRAEYFESARNHQRARMLNLVSEAWEERPPRDGASYYTRKMQEIVFPQVQFSGATIEDAVEFLRVKSRDIDVTEPDPARKGVNIILQMGDMPSTASISLDLKNVPMIEALRYITELAGMNYKVEPYAVLVVPLSATTAEQYTRVYRVPPDFLSMGGGAVPPNAALEILKQQGIPFPEGASAVFDPVTSQLVVKNTQPNLDLVEAFVSPLGAQSYFGGEAADASRAATRILFRRIGPTKEWAENNYYKLRITGQNADLVTVNAFWRDYAAWIASGSKGGFLSGNIAEAGRNFTEMMLALAVLDLPFEAPEHLTETENGRFTFTPGGPCVIYHKEIKPAVAAEAAQGQLLVSQSFFRHGDRYRQEGNEKFEKHVTTEFLTGVTYGANVVVTNAGSSPLKAVVLLQIPQGAMPVLGSKATDSRQVRLEPYTTQTFEYHFYFPSVPAKPGSRFPHFPVNVATPAGVAAAAKPFEFNVVSKLTEVDKASWEYVSQYGSEAEVFSFLEQTNLAALDLERIAWRCRQSAEFYNKLIAFINTHHVTEDAIFRYALLHNDAATLREWLKFHNRFANQCGPYLASALLTLDPIERRSYEHLEYSPLVNQRAHRVGSEWRIANPALSQEFRALLGILAFKPQLDAMDNMSVTYFLFLQDRIEEGLARFKAIDAAKLPTRLQHEYFQCFAAFYEGDLASARGLAAKHTDHPVERWRLLFSDVIAQLNEIEGKDANFEKGGKPDREKQQAELAATEPGFDFKVENRSIALSWKNLNEVTLNYYLMDPEFSFSSNPFVNQDAGRFSIIKPNRTLNQALPKDKTAFDIPVPAEFAKANVLIEVIGAGQRKTQAYHANTLKVTLAENYGRLETRDRDTDQMLAKTYIKVYARLDNGTVRFFKDGYTDLRGRFDYASINGPEGADLLPAPFEPGPANGLDYPMVRPSELSSVAKLALLILSDTHGATVKEVDPPGR